MGSNPGGVDVRIGWDEGEQKEFLKAIRQPLMIQTPLQLVMENLFNRLQTQATVLQQLKEKVDRIAVKDVQGDELLDRIRMLESSHADGGHAKLNPFDQKDILSRLEALEAKAVEKGRRGAEEDTPGASSSAEVAQRLEALEHRLSGVYNVGGKLYALEQIAASMGVAIPDLEYPMGGQPPQPQLPALALPQRPGLGQESSKGKLSDKGESFMSNLARNPLSPRQGTPEAQDATSSGAADSLWPSMPGAGGARSSSPGMGAAGHMHMGEAGARAGSPRGLGHAAGGNSFSQGHGAPSPSRLGAAGGAAIPGLGSGGAAGAASAQKLLVLGQEVSGLRVENDTLKEGLETLKQQVASLKAGLGSNAAESLSRLVAVEEAVGGLQQQAADAAAAARKAGGPDSLSFADFSLLKSQVQTVLEEAKAHGAAASALRDKDLPALTARVEDLAEGVRKAGEPRDMDTLFHDRLNGLEGALGDLRTEVAGTLESALAGAAKAEDLEALQDAVEGKASADQVRLLQAQSAALGQAVAGMADTLSLKPDVGEALRSAAAMGAASGPVISKFKCLTCDQALPSAPRGAAEARSAKGSFLPRLDSMPAAKDGAPVGPGLSAADLRVSKEDRLAGLTVTISSMASTAAARGLKASDVEAYAGGDKERDASPGKAMDKARAARVAVGAGPPLGKPPVVNRTPVFL